jgi:hypothetical protein
VDLRSGCSCSVPAFCRLGGIEQKHFSASLDRSEGSNGTIDTGANPLLSSWLTRYVGCRLTRRIRSHRSHVPTGHVSRRLSVVSNNPFGWEH